MRVSDSGRRNGILAEDKMDNAINKRFERRKEIRHADSDFCIIETV